MMQAELATVLADKHERGELVPAALLRLEDALNLHLCREKLAFEYSEWSRIGFWPSANDHVDRGNPLQDILADNLPKSSLQLITLHGGATMLWNYEAYARMKEKGSNESEIQMLSPNALPFA